MPVQQALDARCCLLKFLLSLIIFLLLMAPVVVMANYSETEWLARNIYHEARGEGLHGIMVVAIVTINRVESGIYPNTVKGVVTQRDQFSWYHNKKIKAIKKDDNYHLCLAVSKSVIKLWKSKKFKAFARQSGLNGVLWYHNTKEKPKWSRSKIRVAKVGKHLLYKDA